MPKKKLIDLTKVSLETFLKKNDFEHFWTILHKLQSSCNEDNEFDRQLCLEQIQLNIPILYFASIYLYFYAQTFGIKYFLFAQRDCVHWHRIFSTLFPETHVRYFACSRNLFTKAKENKEFFDYLVDQVGGKPENLKDTLYVDLFGSGRHSHTYFLTLVDKGMPHPYLFLLSTRYKDLQSFPRTLDTLFQDDLLHVVSFGYRTWNLEILNYDIQGSASDYQQGTVIRLPLEYDVKYVSICHRVIEQFILLLKEAKISLPTAIPRFPFRFYQRLLTHLLTFTLDMPIITTKFPFMKYHPEH